MLESGSNLKADSAKPGVGPVIKITIKKQWMMLLFMCSVDYLCSLVTVAT